MSMAEFFTAAASAGERLCLATLGEAQLSYQTG
jgi:hypothetical protein